VQEPADSKVKTETKRKKREAAKKRAKVKGMKER